MQINVNQSSGNQVELENSSNNKVSQQSTASSSNANASVVDRASLTNDSATVSALQQQAMATPDVRQDKVDALKQQVQSGQYNYDPASTAKAMRENGL
jgi:negative regulator of flagellin synthesis FlgM